MPQLFRKFSRKRSPDVKLVSYSKASAINQPNRDLQRESKCSEDSPRKYSEAKCPCCGSFMQFPSNVKKLKCSVCQVTTELPDERNETTAPSVKPTSELRSVCTFSELEAITELCNSKRSETQATTKEELYAIFEPVGTYLNEKFHDIDTLNNSFKSAKKHELINYNELAQFYQLTMNMPTRSPFYKMLCASNDLLKKHPSSETDFRWILIIWANPSIRKSLTSQRRTCYDAPKILAVAYELGKRCIGYLANLDSTEQTERLMRHLKHMPFDLFQTQVITVNLYITFQLSRVLYRDLKASGTPTTKCLANDENLSPTLTCFDTVLKEDKKDIRNLKNGKLSIVQDFKFKPFEYQGNWHIRCAAQLMKILGNANDKRYTILETSNLPTCEFYNMMLDFIDFKQDFENWCADRRRSCNDAAAMLTETPACCTRRITLCSFPFLLSLGIKISIMEYEVRRIMEYEAENAFLTSLDEGKAVSVYLRVKVRRRHITSDSLRCIRDHQKDLMKSLRVEFVNEPGVDAGGLRKEWFLLLTRSVFSPLNGLFNYITESRLSWFAISPINDAPHEGSPNNGQLYYLFGTVVGLAIFNSTILDLQFPRAFYKKLCGEPVNFNDYLQLYPETGQNLIKMLNYEEDDFTDVFGLTFEITYRDFNKELLGILPNVTTMELCPNGKHKLVTQENKHEFVQLWQDFFMNKSIESQFKQFVSGFRQVFALCESIKLFDHEELERLVCGNQEKNCYEFQMLRSVTIYVGGFTDRSQVVSWFWEIVQSWNFQLQRKLLQFATGSDRVPPGGMSTLPFKISRLGCKDSNKLPLAHTCFNEVCLWEYSSKQKLEHKLWWAVTQSEGYGFK